MITNEEVLRRMGLERTKLLKRMIKRRMEFFGHVARGSAGEELETAVRESNIKKGRGRKRTGWMDAVEVITGSRERWKQMTKEARTVNWKQKSKDRNRSGE